MRQKLQVERDAPLGILERRRVRRDDGEAVFRQLAKQPQVKFGIFAPPDALDEREHDV